jgi:hypothetical protein
VPAGPLADRREVHVVLETEVGPELAAKRLHQALAAPAGQVRGQGHGPALGVQHAGAPDGRLRHLAPAEPGLAGEAVRDLTYLADQRRRAADAGTLVAARHDGPGDVGDGGADELATDVDPDDPAGLGVQLVEDRARAFPARRAADFADQPGARELGERQGHGRLGEPRLARHLGARDRPAATDRLERGTLVDRAQQARGSGGVRPLDGCGSFQRPS